MGVTAEQVLSALKDLKDPSSGRPMSELGYFKHPEMLDGGGVRVRVELPTPASPHKARIEEAVRAMLSPLQLPRVEVAFGANVRPSPAKQHNPNDLVPSVKNVVLVGSGTGDIQLTIAQQVSVSGAVVVTTPQDVALADAIKAKTMFDKVNIPVLGFVENMSGFVCPHCHHETDIFSKGGAEQAAAKLGVPFLGRVPINPAIRVGSDDGRPVVAADPGLPEAQALTRIAQNVADRVALANMTAVPRGQKPLVQLGKKA